MGTDSHTTMVNGLGVLGYGVGGIEAEAVLLGQPLYQPMPRIVGVRLTGELPMAATATDLVLVSPRCCARSASSGRSWSSRATGSPACPSRTGPRSRNMCPEFGATATLFPIDDETLAYLRLTGPAEARVDLVERYAKAQGLWREPGNGPEFDDALELDLATVEPSLAGDRRTARRTATSRFRRASATTRGVRGGPSRRPSRGHASAAIAIAPTPAPCRRSRRPFEVDGHGDGPYRLGGHRGHHVVHQHLQPDRDGRRRAARPQRRRPRAAVSPTVKTSLAPGSKAVTGYLERAGLMAPLGARLRARRLRLHDVHRQLGPLDEPVAAAVEADELIVAAVLSGNRNFEGRIHPLVRARYLASPPLVVAFALAGRVDIDLTTEPLGTGSDGHRSCSRTSGPSPAEIRTAIARLGRPRAVPPRPTPRVRGRRALAGAADPGGRPLRLGRRHPRTSPCRRSSRGSPPIRRRSRDIEGARVLALLGDSVTTDHISPAGSIAAWSPAGEWLQAHGVAPLDFNSYGARRGHHEVMMRGTFGNIRLRNPLADGSEGPYTRHQPEGDEAFIYDAAMRYRDEGVPLS